MGLSTRRLEQLCQAYSLPTPKELVDHICLLWLTFVAEQKEVTTAATAHEAGITTKQLHRLRHRLLPKSTGLPQLEPARNSISPCWGFADTVRYPARYGN